MCCQKNTYGRLKMDKKKTYERKVYYRYCSHRFSNVGGGFSIVSLYACNLILLTRIGRKCDFFPNPSKGGAISLHNPKVSSNIRRVSQKRGKRVMKGGTYN